MSRTLRARLEAVQVQQRDELASSAAQPPDDALLRRLHDETERFERTAKALRRRIDRHRERQRLLDELRSGRPVHLAAWFAVPVVGWALLFAGRLPGASWLDVILVVIASVEAWCWVKQAKRSARLRNDYGSLGSPEDVDADLECIPAVVRPDPTASNSDDDENEAQRRPACPSLSKTASSSSGGTA